MNIAVKPCPTVMETLMKHYYYGVSCTLEYN